MSVEGATIVQSRSPVAQAGRGGRVARPPSGAPTQHGAGMDRQIFGQLDLGTLEPLVAAGGIVGSLLWLALAAFVYASRSPPRPAAGPRTVDLGPEPPARSRFERFA